MEEESIEELFKNACSYVRATSGTLKNDDLLYFYARYKQVLMGCVQKDHWPHTHPTRLTTG